MTTKAWQHRLTPLLYDYLHKTNSFPRDPAIRQRLEKNFQNRKAHNVIILDALQQMLSVFSDSQIPVIVLKGPFLAEKLYQNVILRPMNDIDIIIREGDWPAAKQALRDIGYKLPGIKNRNIVDYAHFGAQLRCYKPHVLLEVHFRLWNMGLPGNEDYIWQRIEHNNLCGMPALVLSLEDTLLHLLIHMNVHRFSRMIWFVDIHKLFCRNFDVDWDYVLNVAERRRMKTALYGALCLTEKIMRINVPDIVFKRLRPGTLRKIVYDRLWRTKDVPCFEADRFPVRFEGPLFYVFEMDGLAQKAQYVKQILFHQPQNRGHPGGNS